MSETNNSGLSKADLLTYQRSLLSGELFVIELRFIQRRDLYAKQQDDGSYICIHKPLGVDHILAHIKGEITLGTYVLDKNNNSKFVVLDADDEGGFSRLITLSHKLASEDIPSYLEKSRRGGHLWFFLEESIPAWQARSFAMGLVSANQIKEVEIFPKQDILQKGPGSLIRLPLGIHRVSRCRYFFYTHFGEPLGSNILEQLHALAVIKTVPMAALLAYQSYSAPKEVEMKREVSKDVATHIKSTISVYDFVRRYVALRPKGHGAIGLCPFHDDHRPSFGVNFKINYWKCFAGCGSGSIIDFWMLWKNCDFKTAVGELREKLL